MLKSGNEKDRFLKTAEAAEKSYGFQIKEAPYAKIAEEIYRLSGERRLFQKVDRPRIQKLQRLFATAIIF